MERPGLSEGVTFRLENTGEIYVYLHNAPLDCEPQVILSYKGRLVTFVLNDRDWAVSADEMQEIQEMAKCLQAETNRHFASLEALVNPAPPQRATDKSGTYPGLAKTLPFRRKTS